MSFDANGGVDRQNLSSIKKTVSFAQTYGGLPEGPEAPEGMRFKGWYTADIGGELIQADTKVTTITDHTLYAQWQAVDLNENYIFVTPEMGGINYFPYYEAKYRFMFEKYTGVKDAKGQPVYGKDNLYGADPDILSALEASDIFSRATTQALLFSGNIAGQNLLKFLCTDRGNEKLYFYGHSKGIDYSVKDASVLADIFTAPAYSYTDEVLSGVTKDIFTEAFRLIDKGDSFIIASAPDHEKSGSYGGHGAVATALDVFKFAGINAFDKSGLISISFVGTN